MGFYSAFPPRYELLSVLFVPQVSFCCPKPIFQMVLLSLLIIPSGDRMSKPSGADNIYELEQLTTNQGTGSVP